MRARECGHIEDRRRAARGALNDRQRRWWTALRNWGHASGV